jgi:hypothetical protein
VSASPCVALHERIKRSTAEFHAHTTPLAIQQFDDGGPALELRNCPRCLSTLAREIGEGGNGE